MSGLPICLWVAAIFSFGEAPALTVEEVIAKHIEALGGPARWSAVKTLKITGTYEAFSAESSFTIYRKRPDLFRFERSMVNYPVVSCFDGEKAWWTNPLMGPQGKKPNLIFEPQNKVTLRNKIFDSTLMDYKEKGLDVSLSGREKLEGRDHYKLRIRFKDDSEETWFIDSRTFLKTAVTGETYEYGRKVPLDEFYAEYREVEGVKIPYYIEQEWHTRHRVFTVDKIEVNVSLDDALFQMPAVTEESPKE